jgi:hypothetical protein
MYSNVMKTNQYNNIGYLYPIRRKQFVQGGIYSNPATMPDMHGDDYVSVGTSTLSGAASGAAAGSVIPGIGTVVGGIIGGLTGLVGGLFGSKSKRKAQRAAAEAERQRQVGVLKGIMENDTQRASEINFNDNTNIYARYGGRFATGGLVQNSSNTQVAYGATHNQYNSNEGGTGVSFGNAEVEGGGDYNGRQYAGEVIHENQNSGQIFSNAIPVVGGRNGMTYAKMAQLISNTKGSVETIANNFMINATNALSNPKLLKTTYAKRGTALRNIEKAVGISNILYGMAQQEDAKLNKLYNLQEAHANYLGLRQDRNRQQYRLGGSPLDWLNRDINSAASLKPEFWSNPINPFSKNILKMEFKRSFPEDTTTSSSTNTTKSGTKSKIEDEGINVNDMKKQGVQTMALNTGMELLNFVSNAISLNQMSKIPIPQMAYYNPSYMTDKYDITSEMQDINSRDRGVARYIKNNTSNSAVARSAIANSSIQTNTLKNKLYDRRNKYLQTVYDINRKEKATIQKANRDIDYQMAMANYQKQMEILSGKNANMRMLTQGVLNGMNDRTKLLTELYRINMSDKLFEGNIGNELKGEVTYTRERKTKGQG